MKNHSFLCVAMLLVSTISYSQINIDAGLSSRMSPTAKIGLEANLFQFNADFGLRVSQDNFHPIAGLQVGYSFIVDRYDQELRLSAGAFMHTGLLPVDKEIRERCLRFGGSIRFKWSVNVFVISEYNGETASIGIGYLFKRKCN